MTNSNAQTKNSEDKSIEFEVRNKLYHLNATGAGSFDGFLPEDRLQIANAVKINIVKEVEGHILTGPDFIINFVRNVPVNVKNLLCHIRKTPITTSSTAEKEINIYSVMFFDLSEAQKAVEVIETLNQNLKEKKETLIQFTGLTKCGQLYE